MTMVLCYLKQIAVVRITRVWVNLSPTDLNGIQVSSLEHVIFSHLKF